VQRKTELQTATRSTSAIEQLAAHDIASLLGRPVTAGGAPVQRAAISAVPASDAQAAPEIAACDLSFKERTLHRRATALDDVVPR
jgi:hypothetical protein